MTVPQASADSARNRAIAIGAGVTILLALAYAALRDFDPDAGVRDAPQGFEAWSFSPSGRSPVFIFGVAALLFYGRGRQFLATVSREHARPLIAVPLLVLASGLHLWGSYVGAPDILLLSLIALVLGGAALLGGMPGLKSLALPALFLLLAIPPPAVWINQVVYPLQLITAETSAAILETFGGTAQTHGDLIFTPDRLFQVIESCSGLRSIETITMSALLYGELFYRSRLQVVILFLSAPVIAFVANQLRVLSIILNPYSDLSDVHTAQGIVLLVIGVLGLAALDRLLLEILPKPRPGEVRRRPPPFEASKLPTARIAGFATLVGLLALSTVALPRWEPEQRSGQTLADFPQVLRGWRSTSQDLGLEFLGSVNFSEARNLRFQPRGKVADEREAFEIFVGIDEHLQRNYSLISDKTALPGAGWIVEARRTVGLPGGGEAEQLIVRSPGKRKLVYHWYEGTAPIREEVTRSLLALDRGPWKRSGRATVVRMSADVADLPELEAADARLQRFVPLVREAINALETNTWNREIAKRLAAAPEAEAGPS